MSSYIIDGIKQVFYVHNIIEKAKHVSFHHVNTRGMCYELHHDFFPGKHVLTVVPTSDQFVSLSYVLIP